jgi:hypothetical protein
MSLSSIICHEDGDAKLVTTECRLVNNDEEGNVIYSKGKTITVVRGYTEEANPIESMFSKGKTSEGYYVKNGIDKFENEILEEIVSLWIYSNFEPDTSNIKSEHITKEVVKGFYGRGSWNKGKSLFDKTTKPTAYIYKENSYTEDEVDDMRQELEMMNIISPQQSKLMKSMTIIEKYEADNWYKGEDYAY